MKTGAAEQLELFSASAERSVEATRLLIAARTRQRVHLTITRNRVMLASVRYAGGTAWVRLHEAFLSAPDAVVRAVGDYVGTRSASAWRAVGDFVRTISPAPGRAPARRLRTRGVVYDLETIRDQVNARFFGGKLNCRIGWGQAVRRRRRARSRSIRFGCYGKAQNLVRINPLLDDSRVPREFVEYIVFHEMLHAAVPSETGSGRWNHHHAAYRALERRFPDLPRLRKLSADLVRLLGRGR